MRGPLRVRIQRFRRPRLPDRHHVKEKFLWSAEQISSNTPQVAGSSLSMIDASHLASYVALWNKFMITGVKMMFLPRYSDNEYNQAVENAGGAVSFAGQLTLVYQSIRSAAPTPASYADALAVNDSKVVTFPGGRPRYFFERRPVYSVDNVDGLGTDSEYTSGFLSTADATDALWYHSAWFPEAEGTGTNPYSVIVTLYITFADAHS